jgi:hypothetical protein
MKYTPKQIEKYQRQKYISFLEKISRNLFRMFRNESINQEQFLKKFYELKKELNKLVEIRLDSQYHDQLKEYLDRLYHETQKEFNLEEIRESNMTQLNRLQKLKNSASYKKEKHRHRSRDQDWG